jgi:Ca2+-binding EF-hand superfamily protein
MTGVYKQFDTGGAGTIDPFEFSTALSAFNSRPSTQKQGTELFSMVDLNGDGEIDYLEFQR